jgi:hypothetical protein
MDCIIDLTKQLSVYHVNEIQQDRMIWFFIIELLYNFNMQYINLLL